MISWSRHDAQPCYCGEDKCVGFIGGKTQTDIAAMDDLYLDGEFSSHVAPPLEVNVVIFSSGYYGRGGTIWFERKQEEEEQEARRRLHCMYLLLCLLRS